MRTPALLRAAVLAILGAALLLPFRRSDDGVPSAAWLDSASDADSLLAGVAPTFAARRSEAAPTAAELDALASLALRAPLYVALPEETGAGVEAGAPVRPRAGRAAAVPFRAHASPGDTVLVRLRDDGGVLDSARVVAGADGVAAAAFRVRPPRAGWRRWIVEAGDDSAVAGAWVDTASAPRVLVRAGFPGWESKFAIRALEESGAEVRFDLQLGRGLSVDAGGARTLTPAALSAFDAVLVLDGAPLAPAEASALTEWTSRGGGVLLAGDRAPLAAFGVVRGGRPRITVDGEAVRWMTPPELAPLPTDAVKGDALPFDSPLPGASLAASSSNGGLLALRPSGRGRAAALALAETWRWRMEAGRVAEHREFWRSLVDWLATTPRDSLSLDVPEAVGAVGIRREVLVYDARAGERTPPRLVVTHPDGAADTVLAAADPGRADVWRAALLPADSGVHTAALAGAAPTAAFEAVPVAASEDAWARLALLAAESGGRAVPADSLRAVVEAATGSLPAERSRIPWAPLAFGALLLAAGAEWAIRRLRGRA